MDEFTPEFIAEQLALAAKATPRPWRTWDSERGFIGIANNEAVDLGTASRADDVCIISEEVNDHHNKEDAAYITAAANNYPAALEEIARLRVTVDAMKTDLIIAFGLIRRAVELLPLDDIGKLEGVRAWQETVHLSDEEAEGN